MSSGVPGVNVQGYNIRGIMSVPQEISLLGSIVGTSIAANPPTPTYVDPWNDTLYEMTRRGTLCVDGSDNNAYEPITSKTRDTA